MRTTKPISTISFNTPDYLRLKLNELLKAGRISFWSFVVHQPEDDEGGKKQHSHVYIEPSKMLQTDDIRKELQEYDPEHPDKPLGCLTFVSSRFDPWYLYGLHDPRYLASKGQSRKFHYVHDDFLSSDSDDLLCKARQIDMVSLSPYAAMADAQLQGITFPEFFARGTIPLPQLSLFEKAWYLLLDTHTNRNNRSGHPMDLNQDTGEIIEEDLTKDTPTECPDEPTWCGATRDEWAELYESAASDSDWIELDPDEELPF